MLSASLAKAATYTLPDFRPAGCTKISDTSITCSSLNLGWNDSIVVTLANTTLTVTGTFTPNGNNINTSSPAAGFTLNAKKVDGSNYLNLTGNLSASNDLTLSSNSNNITGNITAGDDATVGGLISGRVTVGGSLATLWATTVTGDIAARSFTSGGGGNYGGNLSADNGDISTGSGDRITGSITSSKGEVTIAASNAWVGGSISAKDKVTLGHGASVIGNVTSSNDEVVLNSSGVSVGGNVTAKKKITLGHGSSVSGNVTSDIDEVMLLSSTARVSGNVTAQKKVTLESGTQVGGNVTSTHEEVDIKSSDAQVRGCVTVNKNKKIKLGWHARVGGVCCWSGDSCSTTCVDNDSGYAMPSSTLCASPPPTTCVVDNFASGSLNPALWNAAAVSGSFVPGVVDVGGQKRIRLTQSSVNQSTMLQLKKWFPGAGNKIVVDFDYYVYGGNGADGVTVVFSDAAVTPAPGGFGGSLGYAQRSVDINGFSGGWLAVGLDEFGNFTNSTEGRSGYPSGWTPPIGAAVAAGSRKNNVSVRGSGSGSTGYALLANTGTLSPVLWAPSNTASSLNKFRITIDHSDNTHAFVTVERDTTGTGSYVTVVPTFDAKAAPGQAAVPANWLVSFTGSTGGSHSIHEITNLSICSTFMTEPGDSAPAANFECMDGYLAQTSYNNRQTSSSSRNPIYTKLARTGFDLRVVPLAADGSIKTDYIPAGGSSKAVTVELFDDAAGTSCNATISACTACSKPVVATQTATLVSGVMKTGNFTVNKAYQKLMCRVTDNEIPTAPVYGCSSDQFAVRPGAVTLTRTVATATGPSATATPAVKAGANFTLHATTSTSSSDAYSGTLTQNTGAITAQNIANDTTKANGGVVGTLSPASLVANAVAVTATYSEVGYLYLANAAYRDTTFTAIDGTTDCVSGSTSVTLNGGKYGCVVGNTAEVTLGRFYPDHFALLAPAFIPGCGTLTYMGQPFNLSATVQAQNAGNAKTSNFSGVFSTASVVPEMENANNGKALDVARLTGQGTPAWTTGEYPFVATGYSRLAVPDGAYDALKIGLRVDAEPVLAAAARPVLNGRNMRGDTATDCISEANCTAVEIASGKVRFGRIRLTNANGSELLALPVSLTAQYWNGQGFVTNTLDNCTELPIPTSTFYPYTLNNQLGCDPPTASTCISNQETGFDFFNSPLSAGNAGVVLSAPGAGNFGYLDLMIDAPTYLQYNWVDISGFDDNPRARATFGKRKGIDKVIIRREIY